MKFLSLMALAVAVTFATGAVAQDKPADNTQLLLEKVRADKKLLVGANMKLTEEEAKGFWPVYDAYQADLQKLNSRLENTIKAYAEAYQAGAGSVSNEKAKQLLDEALAIEEAEVELKRAYVPKLEKVLPMPKVARYVQIETKIRSAIKNELAGGIPLVN